MFDGLKYRLNGQSYWCAHYSNRPDIHEWDCEWFDLPRKGLQELRLICPNGQIGVLGNSIDASDRLFQYKVAKVPGGVMAHVIGLAHGPDLQSVLYVWDYDRRQLIGPFQDSIAPGQMKYGDGSMSIPHYDALGVKP